MDKQVLPLEAEALIDKDFDSIEIPEFLNRVKASGGEEGEEVSLQLSKDFEAEASTV